MQSPIIESAGLLAARVKPDRRFSTEYDDDRGKVAAYLRSATGRGYFG